jgi:hypothetical protein
LSATARAPLQISGKDLGALAFAAKIVPVELEEIRGLLGRETGL